MDHSENQTTREGPRRDAAPPSADRPSSRGVPPGPGAGIPHWSNPFSWAIAELQGDQEPEPIEPGPLSQGTATHDEPAAAVQLSDPEPVGDVPSPTPGHPDAFPVPSIAPAPTPHGHLEVGRSWPTMAVGLVFGLIGALTVLGLHAATSSSEGPPRPDPSRDAAPDPSVAGRAGGHGGASIDDLRSRVRRLSERIDALDGRVDASKSETAPGISDLRARVGRLSAEASDLAPLAGDIKRIDDRVGSLSTMVRTVTDEIAALRANAEKAPVAPAPVPGRAAVADQIDATPTTAEAGDLVRGIQLFKQDRYKEALGVFNRLELTSPDDARVWYFAALSQGLATDQLTGLTERLVERGIERERAGTPSTSAIEAAIDDLTIAQGREWLEHYRSRIARDPKAASTTPPSTGR